MKFKSINRNKGHIDNIPNFQTRTLLNTSWDFLCFLIFWNYNIIMTFLPYLFFLRPFYTSLSPLLQIHDLFVTVWICVYVYTYVFLYNRIPSFLSRRKFLQTFPSDSSSLPITWPLIKWKAFFSFLSSPSVWRRMHLALFILVPQTGKLIYIYIPSSTVCYMVGTFT